MNYLYLCFSSLKKRFASKCFSCSDVNITRPTTHHTTAHTLGFDKVVGRLVADPRIQAHVITIEVTSPPGPDGQSFKVNILLFSFFFFFFFSFSELNPVSSVVLLPFKTHWLNTVFFFFFWFFFLTQATTTRFNPAATGAVTGLVHNSPSSQTCMCSDLFCSSINLKMLYIYIYICTIGNATFASFLNSLLLAHGRGDGIHFC